MLFSLFLVAAGLLVLFLGGESLIRGSVAIANRFQIPKLVIGLLIIGFGTSMPEMLVSIKASLSGSPEIALGNVVGSNIANVLLIIGTSALILPISGWNVHACRGATFSLLAAIMLYFLSFSTTLSAIHGMMMLAGLMIYLTANYIILSRSPNKTENESTDLDQIDRLLTGSIVISAVASLVGIMLLMLGAELLINGAVDIARTFGVSDAIIGLSLVAFGTSLPELVAAIVSALKRESEVILGSVIGSNIFNILAILGVTLLIGPINVAERINMVDTPLVMASSLGLLVMLMMMRQIGRISGIVMLGLYGCYMVMLLMQAGF